MVAVWIFNKHYWANGGIRTPDPLITSEQLYHWATLAFTRFIFLSRTKYNQICLLYEPLLVSKEQSPVQNPISIEGKPENFGQIVTIT